MKRLFILLAAFWAAPVLADVRMPALFTDHMVLQQGQTNRVWGFSDPGEDIVVTIAGQRQTAKADGKGKWQVTLDAMAVGGPHTLSITGKNKLAVEDVLVGEVWICSGQSNMQFEVRQANDGDLEAKTAKFPKIRLISVPQVGTQELQDDFKGKWEVFKPEIAATESAD